MNAPVIDPKVRALLNAAMVIQRDRRIREWLSANDPKALTQLTNAIRSIDDGAVFELR